MSKRVWENKEKWLGGYVRLDATGEPTFIIRQWKKRPGERKRFHFSTQCHTEGPALKVHEEFEKDPWGYTAGLTTASQASPLVFTAELIDGFFEYQTASVQEGGLGITTNHPRVMKSNLRDWMRVFNGRDLRDTTHSLRELMLEALNKTWMGKSRHHRKAAITGFYSWLRNTKEVGLNELNDPTLRPIDPIKKGARKKKKLLMKATTAQSIDDTRAVLRQLLKWHKAGYVYEKPSKANGRPYVATFKGDWLEVHAWLVVKLATAMRTTEVDWLRAAPDLIATDKGEVPKLRLLPKKHPEGVAVITYLNQKKMAFERATLRYPEQLEALRVVLASKREPPRFAERVKAARKAAGVAGDVRPGTMRATSITLDLAHGATKYEAAARAGNSPKMIEEHYGNVDAPRASKAPLLR